MNLNILAIGLSCMICKGIENFPDNEAVVTGTIDVWWIVQDGQMILLVAYLLKQHPVWNACQIRLFALCHLTGWFI
jgi:potassium/chloride transporter 4/5/6